MNNIAIIPARSGSKSLKDKNIKLLAKKPMMAYSIEAAIRSEMFEEVMVSTDSQEYASVAVQYGAKVPFLRNKSTATDEASSWEVVKEVLNNYRNRGRTFDSVMLLQPTSPLRTYVDIQNAYRLFFEKNAQTIVSVCEMEHSPLWSGVLPEDGSLENFLTRLQQQPRQNLEKYYRINGAIYLCRINTYENLNFTLYGKHSFAYKMPNNRSIDVDTQTDFDFAEYLLNTGRDSYL